jgi:hypothetical protein
MGGSKKGEPNSQYGSGGDPRGRVQNQSAHQQERYENQQGPMVSAFANNYGRGSESNYGDYTDIMNQYRNIASGGGSNDGGSGGGGGGGGGDDGTNYDAFTVSPGMASYNDPFKSYAGMEEFSNTGGYSRDDVSNLRARGVSPIRAAYANAERESGRQRSLQGGYSPNAFAAQGRMAREQGQAAADATQNVEAGIVDARNKGRQFGLTGMAGIEGQRLGADVDLSKFNTGMDFEGQKYNADAATQAQARANAARQSAGANSAANAAASRADQLRALNGMTQLYGTTPGMAATFGNQLLAGVGQGGQFGLGLMDADTKSQMLPGQYEQTKGRVQDVMGMAGTVGSGISDIMANYRKKNPIQTGSGGYNTGGGYQYDPYADQGNEYEY